MFLPVADDLSIIVQIISYSYAMSFHHGHTGSMYIFCEKAATIYVIVESWLDSDLVSVIPYDMPL